jgi:hypothetical protein
MPAPKINRVCSYNSGEEMRNYKQSIGCELHVHVYALMKDKFIIAPVNGSKGAYFEARDVTVLPFDIDDETLGSCVFDNLLWYSPSAPTDFKGKKTDWPAFKAAGMKAVTHFEQTAIGISISTINDVVKIETRPLQTWMKPLYIGAHNLGSLHIEFAASLRNTLKVVSILEEANFATR